MGVKLMDVLGTVFGGAKKYVDERYNEAKEIVEDSTQTVKTTNMLLAAGLALVIVILLWKK